MIQLSAIYDIVTIGCYALIAILLKLLVSIYPMRDTVKWRALIGGAELILTNCLSVLMIVYIALQMPESFGLTAVIFCTFIGTGASIFVYGLNLGSEKKRRLSEQQKAELMDM